MTTRDLIDHLLTTGTTQITTAIEGLNEETAKVAIPDHAMSPYITIGHLSECCIAFAKGAAGETHEWGTFQPVDSTFAERVAEWQTLRASAIETALANADDEKIAKEAMSYLAEHDFYHVGQLCTNRLGQDPEWNYLSIYGM